MPSNSTVRGPLATLAIVAMTAAGACGKKGKVRFEPYSPDAISAARSIGQPVVLYATADW
jgi:hypothetical protein